MNSLLSGYQRLPRCPSIREHRHLIAQRCLEFLDRRSVDEDIIGVVHDMDLRVAAQLIKNWRQGSSLRKALEITLGLGRTLLPQRQSNLFAVAFEGHVLRCTEAFPGLIFGRRRSTLIMYALRDIDEFGQRRLKGRGNEELNFFGREPRELLCQSVKDRWVVQAFLRERVNDGEGSPHESLG